MDWGHFRQSENVDDVRGGESQLPIILGMLLGHTPDQLWKQVKEDLSAPFSQRQNYETPPAHNPLGEQLGVNTPIPPWEAHYPSFYKPDYR
jgi:hypothetical protein